jgi:predicted AAA+ superfamily ATPase
MIDKFKPRFLKKILPNADKRTIVLITGARQTGKTTLAASKYHELNYLNLDAIENRDKINSIATDRWAQNLGKVVIDEAQKEPKVFDKIKYAYDAKEISFSVLLGSSQILLLKNVRESLAGRVSIYELFPLMFAEILADSEEELAPPLIDKILISTVEEVCSSLPNVLFGKAESQAKEAQAYLLRWGGMPALINLPEDERQKWLRDYEYTYLERDLSDLARLNDLQPFRTFQKLAALRTGQLLNYSELARDASISADTAHRYLEYLKLSYQVILLQPYHNNLTRSIVKTPKIYWLDLGMVRQLTSITEATTGALYETMVVSELFKWIKTTQRDAELFFYRTHYGVELDLIIKTSAGIIGVEIKMRTKVIRGDIVVLKKIAELHKQEWLGGLVIYNGDTVEKIAEPAIWAVPFWRLYSN